MLDAILAVVLCCRHYEEIVSPALRDSNAEAPAAPEEAGDELEEGEVEEGELPAHDYKRPRLDKYGFSFSQASFVYGDSKSPASCMCETI